MPYPELKSAVQRAGFNVIDFLDERPYFGCWSLTVEGYGHTYLIVNEGRDGWMVYYRREVAGTFTEIDKRESGWMNDIDKAMQCLSWLSSHRPASPPHKVQDFYVIAEKDLVPERPHSSDWPKLIGYCYAESYFLFFEGKGHGLGGCTVPACEVKEVNWLKIFAILDVEWFIDWLEASSFTSEDAFARELAARVGQLKIVRH